MKDLLVVGNCQVVGLGRVLEAAYPEANVQAWEVWNKSSEELAQLALHMDSCESLVLQPLHNPRYAALAKAALGRPAHLQTVFVHNLYWSGTMPDCKYILRDGPINSPIMNYHSGSVFESFLSGKSEKAAVEAFDSYSRDEVISFWSQNQKEFHEREADVSVKFLDELHDALYRYNCFHVFNHPTIQVLKEYAEKIANTITPGIELPGAQICDDLEPLGAFPVYESVREALNLPYTGKGFRAATPGGLEMISPEEFVHRSYYIYSGISRELLN